MQVVPYCLITATDAELRGLTKVLDEYFPDRPRKPINNYATWIVGRHEEGPTTLIATRLQDMGGLHAAIRTAQIITNLNPSLVLFVGTAASMSPRKARLGDVVIPHHCYAYFYRKVVDERQPDYKEKKADPNFNEFLFEDNSSALLYTPFKNNFDADSAVFTTLIPDDIELEDHSDPAVWPEWLKEIHPERPPKIDYEFGIATCGMLVNSEKFRGVLESKAGYKAPIIDMESFGFFEAVEALKKSKNSREARPLHGIMIRGVSDYAVNKDDTEGVGGEWKRIAIANASRVACELIRAIDRRDFLISSDSN